MAAGGATQAADRTALQAAQMLQDAMIAAGRSLDDATGTRASLARTALKLQTAGSGTSDAIALMSAASYPRSAQLLTAARHQREYLEAMQTAASSRSRTDVRQALRSAQSAGRAASSAYVELGRYAPEMAGVLPEASSFRIAELRSATSAALPKAKQPSTSSSSSSTTATATAPPATAAARTFHAPSGNVTCQIDGSSAACAVASLGSTFVLPASGSAQLESGLRLGRGAGQEVPFGSSVSAGSITCEVPPQSVARGVTCTNASNGHGFEASRVASRQKLF
ncbi:MAG TPA: hypothetical protein VI300_06240 [Solirubrobacter sp.]